jgi:type I protein arginine methyltransferase
MLKDTVRTDAYRDFIYDNKHLFEGKVVIDVGCGSGILSMFCARVGATVYAIDNARVIEKAKKNAQANGLADKITFIKGKMEEIELPVKEVDIIVSEWMGYCLLYEAMLPSVLSARDRYLKKDGLMVPSHCTMLLAPISDRDYIDEHYNFWRDVYGFDMQAMIEEPNPECVNMYPTKESIKAPSVPFYTLNLHEIRPDELVFHKPFDMTLSETIYNLDGFVLWFDTFFLPDRSMELAPSAKAETYKGPGNAFTTGPFGPCTHWKLGLMMFDKKKHPEKELSQGTNIKGTVTYSVPEDKQRAVEIDVTWHIENHDIAHQTWAVL